LAIKTVIPYWVPIIGLQAALLLISCDFMRKELPAEDIAARVNDRVLTKTEVAAWEASLHEVPVPEETRLAFVRHWVEEELLYQEALKQDVLDDPWVVERLDKIKRTLIVSRFLELDASKRHQPAPSAVKGYYHEHSNEFIWEHTHLEIEYWRSETNDGMKNLRAKLLRGYNNPIWTGKPGALDKGSINLNGKSSADPNVWKAISRLKKGEITSVLKIDGSFWIFKLVERSEAGDPKSVEEVQDDIISRLIEETRQNRREDIIHKLINEYRQDGRLQWADANMTVFIEDTVGN